MKVRVTDYALYKWRYQIGYTCAALLIVCVLFVAVVYVPGALRQGELQSALLSSALSMHSIDPTTVINLPYHILQRLIFLALGVTTLSIKLPSVILAAATMFGVLLLVKTWFRRNVAIIVTIIAATTTQFLFLAQDGTPSIMFSFVTIWLLVASTYMTRNKVFSTLWKVVACVLTATAFYIPLGVYVVLALFIAAVLHPHIRYMIRRIAKVRLGIAIVLGLVALVPLVEAIILNHTVAFTLLGIPNTPINLQDNVVTIGQSMFGFFLTSDSYLLRPLYPLGAIFLMGVGAYKFLTVKYTARSYTVFLLAFFTFPLVILNPTHITDLYPLAILVTAMGITTLITNWYRLFPRNPYARTAGLVPITVFVVGMVFTGAIRYINNYTYNPSVLGSYNNDLRLLDRTLASTNANKSTTHVITTESEQPFYTLVAHYDKRFTVSTSYDPSNEVMIVTHNAHTEDPLKAPIDTIITSRKASSADRFYIYKSSTE